MFITESIDCELNLRGLKQRRIDFIATGIVITR